MISLVAEERAKLSQVDRLRRATCVDRKQDDEDGEQTDHQLRRQLDAEDVEAGDQEHDD